MFSLILMALVVFVVLLVIDYIVGQVTDDPKVRRIARIIMAVLFLLWLLQASGLVGRASV